MVPVVPPTQFLFSRIIMSDRPQEKPLRDEGPGPAGLRLAATVFGFIKPVTTGLAYLIHRYGSTKQYEAKIAGLGEEGYIHLSMWLLAVSWPALLVLQQDLRQRLGLGRPDQFLFKVVDDWQDPKKEMGFALLEDKGDAGKFNRAGRAVSNFLEYLPGLVGCTLLAGRVYPFPTFALISIFTVARFIYTLGYVRAPMLRLPGFLSSSLALMTVEGLTLISGLKAVGF